jgi:hypothetical protein
VIALGALVAGEDPSDRRGGRAQRPPLALPIGRFDVELGNRIHPVAGHAIDFDEHEEGGVQPFYRQTFMLGDQPSSWQAQVSTLGKHLADLQACLTIGTIDSLGRRVTF